MKQNFTMLYDGEADESRHINEDTRNVNGGSKWYDIGGGLCCFK
jgi:hypothetical protein